MSPRSQRATVRVVTAHISASIGCVIFSLFLHALISLPDGRSIGGTITNLDSVCGGVMLDLPLVSSNTYA